MHAHAFSHDGAGYEVSFRRMDGQWFATVSRPANAFSRALPAFADERVGSFSEQAIRAGYIGLAEWLVRMGDWPSADDLGLEQPWVKAPVARDKAAPHVDRPAQEHLGRELQAMYAEVLDEPLPDTFLALLGNGVSADQELETASAARS